MTVAHVVEFQVSAAETAWTVRWDNEPEERFEVLPARLVEDLPGGRVQPAASARERPNPMLDGHRAWLDGRIRAASGKLDA